MQRIPVLAEDRITQRWWMKYYDALAALRRGSIEQVYADDGAFLGVALVDKGVNSPMEYFDARGVLTRGTFDEAWKIRPSGCVPVWQLQTA